MRLKDGGPNPLFLAIGTRGYYVQSRILRVPQRFGVFSPGPPLLQVHQASFLTFLVILFAVEFFLSSTFVLTLYRLNGPWVLALLGLSGLMTLFRPRNYGQLPTYSDTLLLVLTLRIGTM
ncbi:hypothetical protein Neosp_000161 [[Neocosmospora] mangrovei]